MKKKITVFMLLAVMAFALVFSLSACDDGKEKEVVFPEMKEYYLTEGDGAHVSNVPYDEYLDYATALCIS